MPGIKLFVNSPVLWITIAEALRKRVARNLELCDLQIFELSWSKYYLTNNHPLFSEETHNCSDVFRSLGRSLAISELGNGGWLSCFWTSPYLRYYLWCKSALSQPQLWVIRCKWVQEQADTQHTLNLWLCPMMRASSVAKTDDVKLFQTVKGSNPVFSKTAVHLLSSPTLRVTFTIPVQHFKNAWHSPCGFGKQWLQWTWSLGRWKFESSRWRRPPPPGGWCRSRATAAGTCALSSKSPGNHNLIICISPPR